MSDEGDAGGTESTLSFFEGLVEVVETGGDVLEDKGLARDRKAMNLLMADEGKKLDEAILSCLSDMVGGYIGVWLLRILEDRENGIETGKKEGQERGSLLNTEIWWQIEMLFFKKRSQSLMSKGRHDGHGSWERHCHRPPTRARSRLYQNRHSHGW